MATLTATPSIEADMASGSRVPSRARWIRPMKRSQSHNPSTTASIPSRYQTFFYSNTENKGFNSKATRFTDHLNVNENPGPADYTTPPDSLEKLSSSFSKRGAGGLASTMIRFGRKRPDSLGPGLYNPQYTSTHQDFNRAQGTSNFQNPIAEKSEAKEFSPAPNSYKINRNQIERNSLITAQASFNSKTPRKSMTLYTTNNPSPDKYDISEKLLYSSPNSHESAFKSKSVRNFALQHKGPGPADYSPFEQKNKEYRPPYYKQKHYLCFSAPALPLPPVPPPPGPGHYEMVGKMAIGSKKATLSGAVFKSITGRGMNEAGDKLEPGPGHYDPIAEVKRSYCYNVHKKWI